MSFYDEYKPFRNYMRKFEILPSLVDVWRYSLHVMEGQALPTDYATPSTHLTQYLKNYLYPWDIDIIAREIILNAGSRGERSLKKWPDLALAINHLRRLDDASFACGDRESVDVMLELHRIAHRQIVPWQMDKGGAPIIRALKIFGEAAVEAIVVRELGMTMRQFLRLGLAVSGSFFKHWGMSTNQDYGVLGISREASDGFFERITCTLESLKADTAAQQSYDVNWAYKWNPLEAKPLIRINPAMRDRVMCPIPRYLTRRVSAGVFYDIVKKIDFDNSFGNSFQSYVGEVLMLTCPSPRFTIKAEKPYYIGTKKMHGVDWILSDDTGHLFIEAKTKRLTVNSKTLSDAKSLDKDISVLATAIVQHYRNIEDAMGGRTEFEPNTLPVYAMILTLDDWFIFAPKVREMLNSHVCRMLAEVRISESVLEDMPYIIASAHEFEVASQVMAHVGVAPLMSKKTSPAQRDYALMPFMLSEYGEIVRCVNLSLFSDELDKLIPQ